MTENDHEHIHTEYTSVEKNWHALAHFGTLAGYMIPFANLAVPIVIMLTKKEEMPSVVDHCKESLNFQISITIYSLIGGFLAMFLVGIPILVGAFILDVVCVVLAGMRASNGEFYRYPLTIRLVK